jgi:peroxiredoxin Q/BCP
LFAAASLRLEWPTDLFAAASLRLDWPTVPQEANMAKRSKGSRKTRKPAARKKAPRGKAKRGRAGSKSRKRAAPKAAAKRKSAVRSKSAGPRLKSPITKRSSPSAQSQRIAEGDRAPSFELVDQSGASVSSAELAGSAYVLYFYPKDDTPGCTMEACGFRDEHPNFQARGIRVIGVSPDAAASHARFRDKYGLTFTLLSDPEKRLANAYGVWVKKQNYGREYMGIERSTFLIDSGGVVKKAFRGVRVPGHVSAVLEQARELS